MTTLKKTTRNRQHLLHIDVSLLVWGGQVKVGGPAAAGKGRFRVRATDIAIGVVCPVLGLALEVRVVAIHKGKERPVMCVPAHNLNSLPFLFRRGLSEDFEVITQLNLPLQLIK